MKSERLLKIDIITVAQRMAPRTTLKAISMRRLTAYSSWSHLLFTILPIALSSRCRENGMEIPKDGSHHVVSAADALLLNGSYLSTCSGRQPFIYGHFKCLCLFQRQYIETGIHKNISGSYLLESTTRQSNPT